jgi:hypothetical protein
LERAVALNTITAVVFALEKRGTAKRGKPLLRNFSIVNSTPRLLPVLTKEFLDEKRKRKVQEMKKLIYKFDIKTDELRRQLICF